jgi:hypothetical protein
MDVVTLKKKLSAYVSDKGYLKNVSDELHFEVLIAWENWTGPSRDFYKSLGFTHSQMAGLIGKAKRMKREGLFGDAGFKPVAIEGVTDVMEPAPSPCVVELVWNEGRIIRFSKVDQLIDFLKKVA